MFSFLLPQDIATALSKKVVDWQGPFLVLPFPRLLHMMPTSLDAFLCLDSASGSTIFPPSQGPGPVYLGTPSSPTLALLAQIGTWRITSGEWDRTSRAFPDPAGTASCLAQVAPNCTQAQSKVHAILSVQSCFSLQSPAPMDTPRSAPSQAGGSLGITRMVAKKDRGSAWGVALFAFSLHGGGGALQQVREDIIGPLTLM